MNIKNPDRIISTCPLGKRSGAKLPEGGSGLSLCLLVALLLCGVVAKGAPDELPPIYIGETVKFTNNTIGPEGMVWEWDFGDGGKSKEKEPSWIYRNNGTYTATLTVDVPNVGKQPPKEVKIEVKPVIATPRANPRVLYIGGTVTFSHEYEGPKGSKVLKRTWDFGDEETNSTDSEEAIPHTYKKSGKLEATLTVDVPNVGIQIEPLPIDVRPVIAEIEAQPVKLKVNKEVTFTNNTDGPKDKMAWHWDFGDGNESTEKSPSHIYKKHGEFKVVLTVRVLDDEGKIIQDIAPIPSEPLVVTVEPVYVQPFITKIEAGAPRMKGDAWVLPVSVEVNGTYKEIKLPYPANDDNNRTFDVPIDNLKPKPELFPSIAKREATVKVTVIPDGPGETGHSEKPREETLSFELMPERSGLFWVLVGVIVVLIGAVAGYMWWGSQQPRVDGQLKDMSESGRRVDLYDHVQGSWWCTHKKRDLEIDLGEIIPELTGEKLCLKFRGRKSDPDRELTVSTSDFELNTRSYAIGENCEVNTAVTLKVRDHKIQYKP